MPFFLFFMVVLYGYLGLDVEVSQVCAQRADIFALLSGTLRTYQRAGCDNDIVTLRCPAGTSISVQIAQYGKSASSKGLCGSKSTSSSLVPDIPEHTTCLLPNTVQTVIEACQKKRQCKFQTSPTTFGGDPCPGIPKYVEVAYKCKPYEFRSKVACENERIHLKCNPNSRVAVYSASYGRTQYESIQCPQPQGVPEEIPRRVLKDQYEGRLEADETDYDPNENDEDFDAYDTGNEYIRESAASPAVPNLENVSRDNFTKDADVGIYPSDKSDGLHFEIQKRYFLYLIISVAVAVLLLISFLVGRFLLQRHRTQKEEKFYATSISDHTLANGFTDDISEVDADIDLQTTLPMTIPSVTVHPVPMGTIAEVVRYPQYPEYPTHMHSHSHTFRGSQVPVVENDPASRSNMRDASTSQYYYG
ncbi:uncharacterized protein LOC132695763 [Cylas formicarius]|uniref:uncharacterized protein LOC132695763 n=1 Tax=Cylas formicarius TaxID=197179 RepID=UPI002958871E|nr:uncharacterized protein LOC132695763 [Cylas formicarius]